MGDVFEKYRKGLTKTKAGFISRMVKAVGGRKELSADLIEEIEDIMLAADIGYDTVSSVLQDVRNKAADENDDMEVLFKDSLYSVLKEKERGVRFHKGLNILLFVGVNGAGKTTTIAKMASKYKTEGKKVMVAAGDTYRAAGIEQMKIWGDRVGVRVITTSRGVDPASVIFDSIEAANASGYDILLIDTAGRLHNNKGLMNELEKIERIIVKKTGSRPDEVFLVVDATTGQNAIRQTEVFDKAVGLTGIIVTKMDGSAKGGVIFPMEKITGLPVKYVGLGEGSEDLLPFEPETYIQALFEV